MTAAEFKGLRQRLGMTVIDYGLALGYDGNRNSLSVMIRRYERGPDDVPLSTGQRAFALARRHRIKVPYL